MQPNQSRRFFYQPEPTSNPSKRLLDEEGPYPYAIASETTIPMGSRAEAFAYLSSGCRELIRRIAFHEDAVGEISAEIVLQEACCPICEGSRRHVLTVDEISEKCERGQLLDFSTMAERAALELRQGHFRIDGPIGYRWTISAPSQVLLSCELCGSDYLTWQEDGEKEDAPATIRSLDVEREGCRIVMRTSGEIGEHTAVIDIRSGFTKVGNRTLFKRVAPGFWNQRQFKADWDNEPYGLFATALSCRSIFEYVEGLLPADAQAPESVDRSCDDPFMFLVCSNRYRNYPSSFYGYLKSARCSMHMERFDGLNILPVEYSAHSMEAVFSMLGLPFGQKRLRRDIFQSPERVKVLASYPDLPFSDPNILHDFVTDKQSDRYLSTLSQLGEAEVSDVWFFLCDLFGDAATFSFMKKLSRNFDIDEEDSPGSVQISTSGFDARTIELLRGCRIADVYQNARMLSIICGESAEDFFAPIAYSQGQKELEASIGGFLFALPKQRIQLIAAGQEMKNCLDTYVNDVGMDKKTIILVFDSARPAKQGVLSSLGMKRNPGRIAAAILVDDIEKAILEAFAPCNEIIPAEGNLADAYHTWLQRHHLIEKNKRYYAPF